ncbi:putative pectinesterase 11 [Sesamum angolense]|uniref:pectinesterase n=1 Tax=Sesamum angolense TaxID=2727404 RepID=A0AAE1W685_9LAMI|nr:putative pectinesterase 11 [Sesamum angolense]
MVLGCGIIISVILLASVLAAGGGADSSTAILIEVDQSGNGDYRKIQDAIDAVPSNNSDHIFILVKPGVYEEKIVVPADKPFITLSGTKATKTIITWSDSGEIFESPTFSVLASDFMARYLTIQNNYGAGAKAVALRVSGDRAAFMNCRILSHQDTLLDDKGGMGAITAQRRQRAEEETGFTFVNCKITGVKSAVLGRPWGKYSRVVFALTYMSNVVLPQGWDDWGDSSKRRTAYYGEYKCYGAGARSSKRVKWSHRLSSQEAAPYLREDMIGGSSWIRSAPSHFRRISGAISPQPQPQPNS